MGAAESTANKLEDKRKSRITHRDAFLTAIDQWERQQRQGAGIGLGPPADAEAKSGVHVCVRKRPLFESEVQKGDYDTVTVQRGTQIVVHDGRMKPDMRNMFMRHTQFSFDHVFSEAADNDEVYAGTAQPLVDAAMAGKIATIFMFGQTGSGKTHTMSAVHERAAVDIFALVDSELDAGAEEVNVMVTYVELAGSACRDMLNKGGAVQLMTDAKGDVKLCGVVEQQVHDADDLVALITDASARRATCATGVHDQSSRSHGVCRITVQRPGAKPGVFTMVDLAGTERGKDSLWHDKELTKETAEINSSLMVRPPSPRPSQSPSARGNPAIVPPTRSSCAWRVCRLRAS
jgi:kinesin family protein 2/24